ncbi:MAG: hypothetical protein KA973_09305 [Candidatus Microthrix sp.]|jgi:hypothetical protein|uniref:Uncharacterized protein n=1 Tax=Candidatus Neomicrothrix parvicella RN1 TaxID=1229780 RepID=R4Z7N5_9ACTN|nr:hypothetical protein [Candidatus Microthrix parvicella]MBP7405103.1 hypothetical protein [Candidatus Microthrix sp.]CCM65817.1 membrane hypothetical protein [Candidatus Microthrix parvicella RN1]
MDLAEPPTGTDAASPESATAAAGCPMHAVVEAPAAQCPIDAAATRADHQQRSVWDQRARKLLFLPADAAPQSLLGANDAFAKSLWISATRCLLIYVVIPLLAPIINLTGDLGPILGIALSLVSMVAIFYSARRFFAGDHPWRWRYSIIAGGVYILLIAQLFIDVRTLLT